MSGHDRDLLQIVELQGNCRRAAVSLGRFGLAAMTEKVRSELSRDTILLQFVPEEVAGLVRGEPAFLRARAKRN
ncbi:hypothetical protein [Jiella avicenniae]|uniref:Uncharacterized protein n=1 Tax=Jiella avicenniae TaxID=2907202 RepID=A0A9X1P5M2_9HYPH|nr:hypothetical protein [Jiella avicenniae]MCE7030968.1 hypothetical protein [Jiella avicenniae]